MAEQRLRPTGKYGRRPATPARDTPYSDHVDATVKLMQPTVLQAANDRPPSHPQLQELGAPHDSMLPPRQPLHLPLKILSGQLSTNTVPN